MVRSFRKKYVILAAIILCLSSNIFSDNDEELFLRANKYYQKHDYENAIHAYDMISNKGHAVLYNMGNCFFHTNDYAQALVYWSRAEKNATPQEYQQIIRNKQVALKKLGKQHDDSIRYKLVNKVQGLLPYVSLFMLQLIFLLSWLIFLFMRRKKQSDMHNAKKVIHACMCLFIVIIGGVLLIQYVHDDPARAIVIKKEAKLFNGPDNAFCVMSSLAYAENVKVKETREGWYKIQYADMLGWVEADVIKII